MLANVNSSTATQSSNTAQQLNPPSPAASGMSFADTLSNEINAVTPPIAPPSPVAQNPATPVAQPASNPPSTPVASNSNGNTQGSGDSSSNSGTSASGSTGSASGTSGAGGKKAPHQSQSAAQSSSSAAASAATAAALASVAAGQGKGSVGSADANSNDATANATKPVSNAPATADQVNSLAGSAAVAAAAGQARDFNAKVPLSDAQGNIAGSTSAKTSAPIGAQTAAAVNPAQIAAGKNNAQPSGEFVATLNKANENAQTSKSETSSIESAATTNSSAPTSTSNSNTASTLTSSLIDASNQIQTVKSANQDLSVSQMNAIAPVLSAPVSNADAPTSNDTIQSPVGSSAWDEEVGQKINWMVSGNQQSASLTLNPPELGPLQVVLSVNNQHANATFTSHQPEVRAALENAIPKLREMLGQSGIQLGDCNVNGQTRQQFAQHQSGSNAGNTGGTSSGAGTASSVNTIASIASPGQRAGVGLVDTFV